MLTAELSIPTTRRGAARYQKLKLAIARLDVVQMAVEQPRVLEAMVPQPGSSTVPRYASRLMGGLELVVNSAGIGTFTISTGHFNGNETMITSRANGYGLTRTCADQSGGGLSTPYTLPELLDPNTDNGMLRPFCSIAENAARSLTASLVRS